MPPERRPQSGRYAHAHVNVAPDTAGDNALMSSFSPSAEPPNTAVVSAWRHTVGTEAPGDALRAVLSAFPVLRHQQYDLSYQIDSEPRCCLRVDLEVNDRMNAEHP